MSSWTGEGIRLQVYLAEACCLMPETCSLKSSLASGSLFLQAALDANPGSPLCYLVELDVSEQRHYSPECVEAILQSPEAKFCRAPVLRVFSTSAFQLLLG